MLFFFRLFSFFLFLNAFLVFAGDEPETIKGSKWYHRWILNNWSDRLDPPKAECDSQSELVCQKEFDLTDSTLLHQFRHACKDPDRMNALKKMIEKGDLAGVRKFYQAGLLNWNLRDDQGNSLLHIAAQSQNPKAISIMKYLLEQSRKDGGKGFDHVDRLFLENKDGKTLEKLAQGEPLKVIQKYSSHKKEKSKRDSWVQNKRAFNHSEVQDWNRRMNKVKENARAESLKNSEVQPWASRMEEVEKNAQANSLVKKREIFLRESNINMRASFGSNKKVENPIAKKFEKDKSLIELQAEIAQKDSKKTMVILDAAVLLKNVPESEKLLNYLNTGKISYRVTIKERGDGLGDVIQKLNIKGLSKLMGIDDINHCPAENSLIERERELTINQGNIPLMHYQCGKLVGTRDATQGAQHLYQRDLLAPLAGGFSSKELKQIEDIVFVTSSQAKIAAAKKDIERWGNVKSFALFDMGAQGIQPMMTSEDQKRIRPNRVQKDQKWYEPIPGVAPLSIDVQPPKKEKPQSRDEKGNNEEERQRKMKAFFEEQESSTKNFGTGVNTLEKSP